MFSPVEVKKYEFGKSLRGYDTTEVRSFLETLANDLEQLTETNRNQTSELDKLRSEVSAYQRVEQNMKEALVNAQEAQRGAREDSLRESELIRREAELAAEKIIRDANVRGDEIRREIETLVSRRDSFVRKLRSLIRSELELIELLESAESEPNNEDEADGE